MAGPVVVERRFNGPPESAQGGYVCGLFADAARAWLGPEPVVVTLHEPPPLGVAMRAQASGARVHFWDRERLVASAARGRGAIAAPEFVAPSALAVAERAYVTVERHPFASCFVCGPGRGDGLGLAPGELSPGVTGCRWTPDASLAARPGEPVPVEFAWAALDCPGGWTVDLAAAPMVLNRFCAEVLEVPVVGAEYVVVGRRDAYDGHALKTTTALYRGDGVLSAKASATWVRLRPVDS
ncbi:hypothetical protein KDL01_16575 [Actinospica durhamensis]|uniref:Thioesterase family protein n=1 Tax=Actinospica durhamensis TaxID=1508375 RepID=A0A941EM15_9ACTN|nr:hypothetical protein [Actinospica durhamensis]MBR7834890.1 hypothetical protein [Actinospica durhamensis]